MEPEQQARENIDALLEAAGWAVQDYSKVNLGASLGVAVREFPLSKGAADYLLFVDRKAVGVIEAKAEGKTLIGVSEQTDKYLTSKNEFITAFQYPLPFGYESTGVETYFRDLRDPNSRSRQVFAFHQPQTLLDWVNQQETLRSRLKDMPRMAPLHTKELRDCQAEAITNLEVSFSQSRPKALVQMATGSGKTFMAVSEVYRLIKHAKAKRVLFLVDRNNLGRQTLREFQQYVTPDDGRKFTELYNVQNLTTNTIDPVNKVCITTIQRLFSMLKGENEFDPEQEEESLFELSPQNEENKKVEYNQKIPIETFDFIITDECHRSIYNLWRQVLEYFDAFIIGLTATPSKQTLGFFDQNLVMEYGHERAVADNVNVPFDVYRIKTKISSEGSKVDAGFYVGVRDKKTRKERWEELDETFEYDAKKLDRSVIAKNQIRTIIKTFKEKLFTEIFPGRTEVPKTLVFAKNDSHAEDIVQIIREEFGKGNDFCKKITYRTTGAKPEDLIASFRNSYNPRIAVTVDMVSTGTDIKPLECLLFMRDVKSRVYFEQMKGRGTRTINSTDLRSVTPDTPFKTSFIIVDAVGVCEHNKTDSKPLERKRKISFEKLLQAVALGKTDEDALSSLAGRLSRLRRTISQEETEHLNELSGKPLRLIINSLLDAIDVDKQIEEAKREFKTKEPSEEQIAKTTKRLVKSACAPFDKPEFREELITLKKQSEQIIDEVSQDQVVSSGFDGSAKEAALHTIESFKKFIADNKDELTALQLIYSKPYSKRHLTYEEIKQLADSIKKPPYNLTTDRVWRAFEQLEKSKVRGAGPRKLLTDLVSLVRFATEQTSVLEPFSVSVEERFNAWLEQQKGAGVDFTLEQLQWLGLMKDHVATSLSIEFDDFEATPFYERGGLIKAQKVFGKKLKPVIEQLNTVLVK